MANKILRCKKCKSDKVSRLNNVTPEGQGKWIIQGECYNCGSIMRFTKHGSYIYKLAANKSEGVPS